MSRRVILDLQGAQTNSRFRGIGRYILAFSRALVLSNLETKYTVLINGSLVEGIADLRRNFQGLEAFVDFRIWYGPKFVPNQEHGNTWRRRSAEIIRADVIRELSPDAIYLGSYLDVGVDVSTIGENGPEFPTFTTFYDAIPYLYPEIYLNSDPWVRKTYLARFTELKNFQGLFAISKHSQNQAIDLTGIAREKVSIAMPGEDSRFAPLQLNLMKRKRIRHRLGITRDQYVLYSGGGDVRKNLDRLVEAYSLLATEIREQTQLIFAGRLHSHEIEYIDQATRKHNVSSEELILLGYVSDEDLRFLYSDCSVFAFPSWHEGFGLPALEAMSCGSAVVAANNTSLIEILNDESVLFDPYSSAEISRILTRVLLDSNFRIKLENDNLIRAKDFSWAQAGMAANDMLMSIPANSRTQNNSFPSIGLFEEMANLIRNSELSEAEIAEIAYWVEKTVESS